MRDQMLKDLGMPADVMRFVNYPTRFDCRETLKALKGTDIAVPPLESYAWRLWDYWERHLDPELFIDRSLSGAVKNKVVLITGASAGIGKAAALKIAEAGAKFSSSPAPKKKLLETQQEIEALRRPAFYLHRRRRRSSLLRCPGAAGDWTITAGWIS
jgi:hypothetical protein